MPFRPSPIAKVVCTLILFVSLPSFGLTVETLRRTPLTPQEFAHHFRNFQFVFRKQVQKPEVFLASRAGDCDDFSTLAAAILREKGYTPRLISVRMPGITHVVCYIEESESYLDYNNRAGRKCLVPCSSSLAAIANSVASSYGSQWTSVSEFTFSSGTKRLVKTDLAPGKQPKIFASLFR